MGGALRGASASPAQPAALAPAALRPDLSLVVFSTLMDFLL